MTVLYITGWIESESSNTFSTPTDNWTWTWFGKHIYRHDTRLLIFWNKDTIVKLLLLKTNRNVNVFNSRSNAFDSTTEIQLVLSSQFTVGSLVWSSKDYIDLWIALFFLTALYTHIVCVESEAIYGWICTSQQTATPRRVWIIPEIDRLLLTIIEWSASWCNSKRFWVMYQSKTYYSHQLMTQFLEHAWSLLCT